MPATPEYKHIGEIFRKIRKEFDLTQQEVGDLIGVKQQEYSRYEKGEVCPSFIRVLTLFRAFGYELQYGLRLTEDPMEVIKKWRDVQGITQAEYSKRSSIHPIAMSRYDTGKAMPTLRTLRKLTRGIGQNLFVGKPIKIQQNEEETNRDELFG